MEPLNKKEKEALRVIKNYLVHYGRTPSLREIGSELGYKSPNSSAYVVISLRKKGYLVEKTSKIQLVPNSPTTENNDSDNIETIDVPLLGAVPCGPKVMVEENILDKFPISTKIAKKPHTYYLLRANGDSMDLAGIKDGDLLLIKQQECADDGDKVVAMIDGEVTVKVLKKSGEHIALVPKSTNKELKPIIISDECQIRGVVADIFPKDFLIDSRKN